MTRLHRWVGIAAITVYAPTIFAEAGYGARKSQWLSGLNDVSTAPTQLFVLVFFPYCLRAQLSLPCSPTFVLYPSRT